MAIPIIMLHHIVDLPGKGISNWSISTRQFNLLLDLIEQKNLITTTFDAISTGNAASHQKLVVISFDDCPATLFDYAVPELIKRKMKAVFSIPTAQIGGFNMWDVTEQGFAKVALMDAEQLQYLSSQGMEIASHGQHHLRASEINETEFTEEISASKQYLEALLNKQIYTFTYPYGEVPKRYRLLLKQCAYQYGLSIYQPRQNNLALRRIGIHQADTAKSIAYKLSQSYQLMRNLLDPLLSLYKLIKP
ncbi:hypothetical protein ASE74_12420 [Pedobacter sp. Leaf216]|uniref:polysaccharide deacetylase family protein n=1 Tax=Pedobacter sp. Leaf216 TaxID=1735684 RepID=UPI0006F44B8F|nr:polysaccharide deacetylase family protein [Pedobacter sp. Leaf216]KQM63964.1 hypothetical protein ASE74_12420 [Pedobacter sp. Leaf216]